MVARFVSIWIMLEALKTLEVVSESKSHGGSLLKNKNGWIFLVWVYNELVR